MDKFPRDLPKTLDSLILKGAGLHSFDGAEELPALIMLDIGNNEFSDLAGLREGLYPNLEQFFAGENQLHSMDGVEHCTKLSFLALSSNQLEKVSMSCLLPLCELKNLTLTNNKIANIPEDLAKITSLKMILVLH